MHYILAMIPLNCDETIFEKGIIMRLENKVALITGSGGGMGPKLLSVLLKRVQQLSFQTLKKM